MSQTRCQTTNSLLTACDAATAAPPRKRGNLNKLLVCTIVVVSCLAKHASLPAPISRPYRSRGSRWNMWPEGSLCEGGVEVGWRNGGEGISHLLNCLEVCFRGKVQLWKRASCDWKWLGEERLDVVWRQAWCRVLKLEIPELFEGRWSKKGLKCAKLSCQDWFYGGHGFCGRFTSSCRLRLPAIWFLSQDLEQQADDWIMGKWIRNYVSLIFIIFHQLLHIRAML